MNTAGDNTSPNLFDHPEIHALFGSTLADLVGESDRGAVLIGASIVDAHLRILFERLAPREIGRRKLRAVLEYPGPLSTFSARAEVAHVVRFIDGNLKSAIDALRRLRNSVAHSQERFSLRDHGSDLRQIFQLGDGVPVAINRTGLDMMMRNVVSHLLALRSPVAESEPLFRTPAEVVEYLAQHPGLIDEKVEPNRLRYELGIGVALICALIIYHRDEAERAMGEGV